MNIGCIDSLTLPEGWVERIHANDFGKRQIKSFHPSGVPEVRFCSYLRGTTLSRPAADAFQRLLYSDFHPISQQEIDEITDVIEAMADHKAFQIEEAETAYVSDKRAVKIHGRWLNTLEETISCLVDVRGDGHIVQQVYFCAPVTSFAEYREAADRIFKSIKWKLHVEQ